MYRITAVTALALALLAAIVSPANAWEKPTPTHQVTGVEEGTAIIHEYVDGQGYRVTNTTSDGYARASFRVSYPVLYSNGHLIAETFI